MDWLSGLLYWADAGLRRVEVARTDGRYRRLLVSEDIDSPTSLLLHPTGQSADDPRGHPETANGLETLHSCSVAGVMFWSGVL